MLSVRNLSFSYGAHHVFSGVEFSVRQGSLCGLFGPNGSGKTTLFRCCLGLLHASAGSVTVNGTDVAEISAAALAKIVSYVPQSHTPPFPFLVREVVLMGRAPHFGGVFGVSREDRRLAGEAMERLGISDLAGKAYTQLSGGQRQLVLIARAIAQDTPLLMLDEPTSSLDFKNQLLIWNILRDIAGSGKTVCICAHDPNHVSWFCSEVVVMNKGSVVAAGDPGEVLDQPLLDELYGGVCAVDSVSGLRMIYPGTVR